MAPVTPELLALGNAKLDVATDPDAFRLSVADFLESRGAEFELRAQLCVDLDAMPVEDASKDWSQKLSPYVAVARVVVPPQDAYSPVRQAYMDDVMAFRPSHGLRAHRPLGSLMRARLATYGELSAYRHHLNGIAEHEPRDVAEIPD